MSNLLIIEPHSSGHRACYVGWIAKAAVESGHCVQVATLVSSAQHDLFRAMQKELGSRLQMVLLDREIPMGREGDTVALVKREFYYRQLFKEFFKASCDKLEPDIVFVPYLDYCANAVAMMGSPFSMTPWSGIVMRMAAHFTAMKISAPNLRMSWLKRKLFLHLLGNRTLRALFTIDETLDRFIREHKTSLANRLFYLSDPAKVDGHISREAARRALGIPAGAVVVLVYGTLGQRKGVDSLLRAVTSGNFPFDLHILIAGLQGNDCELSALEREWLNGLERTARVHRVNKFLSAEEEYGVFKASDIVWLGYRGHYVMSGVMVQAGQMGLPVIACRDGLIGWTTKVNRLGVVVNIDDPIEVQRGITELVQDRSFAEECGTNGTARFGGHTVQSFTKSIIDIV